MYLVRGKQLPRRSGGNRGFSFVELIIVIVLLGIIAAVALPRMLRSEAYNAAITRDQIVSIARSAQQKAIGRSDIKLKLEPSGNNLVLLVTEGATDSEVQRSTAPIGGLALSAELGDALAVPTSCAVTPGSHSISPGNPLVVAYDSLGDLWRGGVEGLTPDYPAGMPTGLRICVNNDPRYSVCISASGFAYVGDCDD